MSISENTIFFIIVIRTVDKKSSENELHDENDFTTQTEHASTTEEEKNQKRDTIRRIESYWTESTTIVSTQIQKKQVRKGKTLHTRSTKESVLSYWTAHTTLFVCFHG
jgi:hypothetical protein